jgi:hypothetical protein
MPPTSQIGFGCPSYDDRILRLAALSPRSALALVTGAIRAPFTPNVVATFGTVTQTLASGDLDVTILGADTWVTDVTFDIQCGSAFTGSALKTLSDYFYNKTSGLAAKCHVTGSPRYDVAPNFTPLSSLFSFIADRWPDGWLLNKNNSVHMDFAPLTVPFPFAPLTVTVTFQAYQYICPDLDSMPLNMVYEGLKECGYDVDILLTKRIAY